MDAAISVRANPFPGLRPFRENETHLFFGRENQVDAMVDKLAATNFLAVIGTSGSGKSSLVNCGLRPALRQGLMARSGTAWRMAQFRPGNDPIGAMARALAQDGVLFGARTTAALSMAEIVETTLRMSRLGLVDICEQAALDEGVNLLVVADQFEELFRYRQLGGAGTFAEDAAAFVNLLLEVRAHPSSRIFVVLTMRSDFLGDCTQFPGLAEAINGGQYLVPRMTRDERRDAIERPVGVGGAQIEPVLLTRLVNDVGDNPDQLSILQHALNRTWARWEETGDKGPLDLADYEAIGTMGHALDRHADQAYAELSERQKQIAEKLFKALTDKATDPRGVRRPTTMATLCALADATPAEVTQVIDVFRDPSRSFLMPPAGEPLEPGTVVDISHESLMRVWQRLTKWADEEALSARAYRRLAEAAELHAAGDASLWRDPELQLALDWRDKNQPNETWATRYHPGFAAATTFLTASSDARAAERAERQLQHERERQAERDKAATQAKYTRWMTWATAVSVVLMVFAVAFGVMAVNASKMAEQKERDAQEYLREVQITQSRWLINEADRSKDPSMKVLAALEALPNLEDKIPRPLFSQALESLALRLGDLREIALLGGRGGRIDSVAMTPDASRIATGSDDGTVRLLNDTGVEVLRFKAPTDVSSIAMAPDGSRIVTGLKDATVRVWNGATGAELLQLKGHASPVTSVTVTADGAYILSGSEEDLRLWDGRTGVPLRQFDASVTAGMATMPDGHRIVVGAKDGTARLWDAASGTEILQLQTGNADSMAMTPDASRVVTGSPDGTVELWNVKTGGRLLQVKAHADRIYGVAITTDGERFVTVSGDGSARLWDARNGVELVQFNAHVDEVLTVAMSRDGLRVGTSSSDGTARLWDARSGTERLKVTGSPVAIRSVAVMPDGTRIITGSDDNTASLRDSVTGTEVSQLNGHTGSVRSIAVTPDGTRIVTGSLDGTTRLWDAASGAQLSWFKGPRGVLSVAVTPTGDRIVTGSEDAVIRIWDTRTGQELLQMKPGGGRVYAVAVTPNGSRVVTASADSTARIWDAATGAELHKLKGHSGAVVSLALTPDGRRVVTGSADETVRVWDIDTGAQLLVLTGHEDNVAGVAVTPDGSRIVSGSADGTVRVWDAATGVALLEATTNRVSALAVTPDGRGIVAASADRAVRLWDIEQLRPPRIRFELPALERLPELVERARTAVPRCLTIAERIAFVPDLAPPVWCVDRAKYPYDSEQWKAWKARKMADAADDGTAEELGNAADKLLKSGDFRKALEAAELGLQFGPKMNWIVMNKAHALMFLGRLDDARSIYKSHRGEELQQGKWEDTVLDDFKQLREAGRVHPLMAEIEKLFKGTTPKDTPPQ